MKINIYKDGGSLFTHEIKVGDMVRTGHLKDAVIVSVANFEGHLSEYAGDSPITIKYKNGRRESLSTHSAMRLSWVIRFDRVRAVTA